MLFQKRERSHRQRNKDLNRGAENPKGQMGGGGFNSFGLAGVRGAGVLDCGGEGGGFS